MTSTNPFRSSSRDHLPSAELFTSECLGNDAFERLKTSRLGMTPMAAPSPKPWTANANPGRLGYHPSSTPFASPIPNRSSGSDDRPHSLDAVLSSPAVKQRPHQINDYATRDLTGIGANPLQEMGPNERTSRQNDEFSFVDMNLSFSGGPFSPKVVPPSQPVAASQHPRTRPISSQPATDLGPHTPRSTEPQQHAINVNQQWFIAVVEEVTKRVVDQLTNVAAPKSKVSSSEVTTSSSLPSQHPVVKSDLGKATKPLPYFFPLPDRRMLQYGRKPRDTRFDIVIEEDSSPYGGPFTYYEPNLFALRTSLRSERVASTLPYASSLRMTEPILRGADEVATYMAKRHSAPSDIFFDL